MKKGTKITLIVLGVIGTGVGLWFLLKPPKSNKKKKNLEEKEEYKGPKPYSNNDFPLKQGSGGSRVEALQRYLNDKTYWINNTGYQTKKKARSTNNFFEGCSPQLVVDGKWGPKTTECWLKMRFTDDDKQDTEIYETYYNDYIKKRGYEK